MIKKYLAILMIAMMSITALAGCGSSEEAAPEENHRRKQQKQQKSRQKKLNLRQLMAARWLPTTQE